MILFITTSYDATVDLLIGRADPGETFRLNYDLWQDYSLDFTHRGWRISDPTGRTIGSDTVTACFWWKAFNDFLTGTDPYVADEVRYHLRDLYGWCAARGITSGNPPDFHNRLGKLTILRMASRYFPVPATSSGWNVPDRRIPHPVAKSLSSTPVGDGRVLYAQAVEESRLDPQYPWTLQERVDAEFDATVFLCGRDLFAFRRDRLHLQGLDWRVEVFDQDVAPWERFALSPEDHDPRIRRRTRGTKP